VQPTYLTVAGASPHSGGGISLPVGSTVETPVEHVASSSGSGDALAKQQQQQQQQHVQYSARTGSWLIKH
jgi:enterochelin esterase-like enzyme